MSTTVAGTLVFENDAEAPGFLTVAPVEQRLQIDEPIIGLLQIENGAELVITEFAPTLAITEINTELDVIEETVDLTIIEGGYFPNARAELIQDPFYLFGDIEGGVGGKLGIQTALRDVLIEEPGEYDNPHLTVDRKGRVIRIRQGALPARDVEFEIIDVELNGQLQFFLSAQAHKILAVEINQLNYLPWCELNPPSSGRVLYTPPEGGYIPEAGDTVIIYFQRE